jgi:hypothetical protein
LRRSQLKVNQTLVGPPEDSRGGALVGSYVARATGMRACRSGAILSTVQVERSLGGPKVAMQFDRFLASYPQVRRPRPAVDCQRLRRTVSAKARAFDRFGMLMLRSALHPELLRSIRREYPTFGGDGDRIWDVKVDDARILAPIIPALLRSWSWPTIEAICGSSDIVFFLSICIARRIVDRSMGIGAHQDAVALPPEAPLSIWIPLDDIVPGQISGLGFIVKREPGVLSQSNNDIGGDYVLANTEEAWVPSYRVGDLSVHHNLTPHFTTGYGTARERVSVEIRCAAAAEAPARLQDPALRVRRTWRGRFEVQAMASKGSDAEPFLALMASQL